MKILQVNCVYKRGSTGKIVNDIHTYLREQGHESIVCYGRGQKENESGVYKTSSEIGAKLNNLRSRIMGLQYNGAMTATQKLIRIIKKENPDIVHLHCINGYFVNIYRLLEFLKTNDIRTVLTLHAEFMHTGSCGYAFECEKWKTGCGECPQLRAATKSLFFDRTAEAWDKMKNAFLGFDQLRITSVSSWLKDRAKQSPILKHKQLTVVENGTDTRNIFYPRKFESLKIKHGLIDEKVILHTTASFTSKIKGGKFVVELAKRMQHEKVKFIIVGYDGKNESDMPNNMILIRHTNDQQQLAQYYSMADLTILTSRRETFSMPCAESLACGTPVVGFKAGGPETISLKDYSEFVEYGDIDALEQIVRKWLVKKEEVSAELADIAIWHYSKERMCEGYIQIYKNFESC
jgi:putative colanic acid biosynthesis glycosyltransferase